VRELRLTHEAVVAQTLQPDGFRRAMEHLLVATATTTAGTGGRPAELFRRGDSSAVPRRQATR
jgi:8-oxo-dGTP diphosphatase